MQNTKASARSVNRLDCWLCLPSGCTAGGAEPSAAGPCREVLGAAWSALQPAGGCAPSVIPSRDNELATQIFNNLDYFLNIPVITTEWGMEVILLTKTLFKLIVSGICFWNTVLLKLERYSYINCVLGIHFPCSCEHFQGRCRWREGRNSSVGKFNSLRNW